MELVRGKDREIDRTSTTGLLPKEVLCVYHAPDRKLIELGIVAKITPVPGILATIARTLAERNVRILSLNFTSRGELRYVTLFADFTHSTASVEEVVAVLRKLEFVKRLRVWDKSSGGLIVDALTFPPTTAMGAWRLLLIPARALSGMLRRVYKELGTGGAALAYHQGRVLGIEYASIATLARSPEEALNAFFSILQAQGWGVPEVAEIDLEEPKVVIRLFDNFEALAFEECARDCVCHFTRGLLAGAFSEILKLEANTVEIRCKARGDRYCEFVISKRR